jgi:anti-anti-sigma factor
VTPLSAEALVLPLAGDLCIAEVPEIRQQIDDIIASGARDLVLDLSEATLLTAAALRVIDTTEHRLQGMGGSLRLQNPRRLPRRVLEITGFDRLIA